MEFMRSSTKSRALAIGGRACLGLRKAQREIERAQRFGDLADRQKVHPGLGIARGVGQGDAARGLEQGAPGVVLHGRLEVRGRKIVEMASSWRAKANVVSVMVRVKGWAIL